jgi:MFS family permease
VSRAGVELRRTFEAARRWRNFRLYLIGQLISAAGTWMNFTASSWLVLELTGDGVALGVNAALMFGPTLLLAPIGGVLADRFDKRRILTWTATAFATTALAMWGLVSTGAIELWMVYSLSFVTGTIVSLDMPARHSFYVEMVGPELLTNAVSLNSAAFTGARLFGQLAAGALILAFGIGICFLVDGFSYLAMIAALAAMRPDELHPQERSTRERGHLFAGLRYVWRTDELRQPILVVAIVFTVAFQFAVTMPLLAKREFNGDAGVFALMSGLTGVGMFAAGIMFANRNVPPTMRRLGTFVLGFGIALVAAGVAPTKPIAYLAMVPLGFTCMAFMITANTLLQLRAAPQARGRVMALYGAVFLGSTPLGSVIIGWVGEHVGARATFHLGGIIAMAVGASVLWLRRRSLATMGGPQRAEQEIEGGAAPDPGSVTSAVSSGE